MTQPTATVFTILSAAHGSGGVDMTSHIGRRRMLTLVATAVAASRLAAQGEPGQSAGGNPKADPSLRAMYRSAAQYTLSSADEPGRAFALRETPALRSSNPVSGNKDGAIFLWTDRGRPQAALKLFTYDNKRFTHFWQSLSD